MLPIKPGKQNVYHFPQETNKVYKEKYLVFVRLRTKPDKNQKTILPNKLVCGFV